MAGYLQLPQSQTFLPKPLHSLEAAKLFAIIPISHL